MIVDSSEWYTERLGLLARKYSYSKMRGISDFSLEVHFKIQAGLSIFTFVQFLVSSLDLPQQTVLQVTLSRMDDRNICANLAALGGPLAGPHGQSGAALQLATEDDVRKCIDIFLQGKDLQIEVRTNSGEMLANLPLPNDKAFESAYISSYNRVKAADEDRLGGATSPLDRLERFIQDAANSDHIDEERQTPTSFYYGEIPKATNDLQNVEDSLLHGLLDLVREQLLFIQGEFFGAADKRWPQMSFSYFIRFPIVAGYTLGVAGELLRMRNIRISDTDLLLSVMQIHDRFQINSFNIDILHNFLFQNREFKFGLQIGATEASRNKTFSEPYFLLTFISQTLLRYRDFRTLKLNVEIFCNTYGTLLDKEDLIEFIERWISYRQTSLKWSALLKINPLDFKEAIKWSQAWAHDGDFLIRHFLGSKYEEGLWFEIDLIEALKWYKLATIDAPKKYSKLFMSDRDRLSARLSAAERVEADRRVQEFLCQANRQEVLHSL